MAELAEGTKRSLKATATIAIAEAFTDGQLSVSEASHPFARILEFLDSKICALCASVRGKVLRKDSDEFRKWRLPSHINCRRTISHLKEGDVDFVEPDPELIRKHGHYHFDPNKHAELRVPAEPAGRNFIRRRVKNTETGEIGVALDWAPWWEQIPQWKRDLVLQARGTTSRDELRGILAKLGITNLTDPDQLRLAARLALQDRVEGWITEDEPTPARGRPVSTALRLEGVGIKPAVKRALKTIDKTHGDGNLPEIPVQATRGRRTLGAYVFRENTGRAIEIRVSKLGAHKELTTAHEVGHFLDHHGFGVAGEFSSVSDRLLAEWREAVQDTEAVKKLKALLDVGYIEERDGRGNVQRHNVSDHLEYLLTLEELWARSYAQFIATRSAEELLIGQLNRIRESDDPFDFADRHWKDADFEPVAKAIDALFKKLGWIE